MDDLMVILIFILMVIIALLLTLALHVKLAPADYNTFEFIGDVMPW